MRDSISSKSFGSPSPKRIKKRVLNIKYSKISLALNSTTDVPTKLLNLSSFSKLAEIKTRKEKNEPKVSPELASLVVKSYIIPLFTQEKKVLLSRSRSTALGGKSEKNGKKIIKLSDHINNILASTKEKLQFLLEKLAGTQKETEKLTKTLETARSSTMLYKTITKFNTYNITELIKQRKNIELSSTFCIKEKLASQTNFLEI